MKLRKKVSLAVVALLAAGSLASCSAGGNDSQGPIEEFPEKWDEQITIDVFDGLANYMGVQQGWFAKIPVQLTLPDGTQVEASTYVIPGSLGRFAPSDHYVRDIVSGSHERGFPQWYADRLQAAIDEYQALAADGQ